MSPATHGATKLTTPPRFAYNHPKNYFGVPLAVAADGATGALVTGYIVGGAGAAKQGATDLDFLTDTGNLTDRGIRIVSHVTDTYDTPRDALEHINDLHGDPTRFITTMGGIWNPLAADIIAEYRPAAYVISVLQEEGDLTLPELAYHYYIRDKDTAETLFIRDSVSLPSTPSETADRFYDAEIYRTQFICQFKSILYHCGVLTENGQDSVRVTPLQDTWALESDTPSVPEGRK